MSGTIHAITKGLQKLIASEYGDKFNIIIWDHSWQDNEREYNYDMVLSSKHGRLRLNHYDKLFLSIKFAADHVDIVCNSALTNTRIDYSSPDFVDIVMRIVGEVDSFFPPRRELSSNNFSVLELLP